MARVSCGGGLHIVILAVLQASNAHVAFAAGALTGTVCPGTWFQLYRYGVELVELVGAGVVPCE